MSRTNGSFAATSVSSIIARGGGLKKRQREEIMGRGSSMDSYTSVYTPSNNDRDYSIHAGEFVFCVNDIPDNSQKPCAEVDLSRVMTATNYANTTEEAKMLALYKSIRILGPAITNVEYNRNDGDGDPVVYACGGLVRMRNTGDYTIYPGDIVMLELPPVTGGRVQAPADGAYQVGPNRKVLATVPLNKSSSQMEDAVLGEYLKTADFEALGVSGTEYNNATAGNNQDTTAVALTAFNKALVNVAQHVVANKMAWTAGVAQERMDPGYEGLLMSTPMVSARRF